MKSHQVEFSAKDILQIVVAPLLVTLGCAVLVHAAAQIGAMPGPRPTLDADRTILIHQVDAARTAPAADVVLLGDSSCLMNVSARELSSMLGRPVLNLGTLSYLDPAAYALLLQEHTRRHDPKAIVLLMHPEALRRLGSENHQLKILTSYLAGRDDIRRDTIPEGFNYYSGVDLVNGRLLARLMPSALRGAYGAHYGFSTDLDRYMTEQSGSVIDPGSEKFSGNAEYRLAPTLARNSQIFRAAVPASSRLFVGMTPVPAKFAGPAFPGQRDELLKQWAEWLSTDGALTNLPAVLPEDRFSRVTHLRPSAISDYTKTLGAVLRERLP